MSEILAAALVAITAYYAWQNRRMVKEMQATRALQILPKLSLQWYRAGPVMAFIRVVNAGVGPALDVDVTVTFRPRTDSSAEPDVRRLQTNLMLPGDFDDVFPGGESIMDMPALAATFERIELTGSYSDAAGGVHQVDDVLPDIARWREIRMAARTRWVDPDREKRLVRALDDKFGRPLKEIPSQLRELRWLVERAVKDEEPPEPPE